MTAVNKDQTGNQNDGDIRNAKPSGDIAQKPDDAAKNQDNNHGQISLSDYFKPVFEFMPKDIKKIETISGLDGDARIIARLCELIDLDGAAKFEIDQKGNPIVSHPNETTIQRNNSIYLMRGRSMHKIILHLRMDKPLPDGVAIDVSLSSNVRGMLQLTSWGIDPITGYIYVYVNNTVPIQIDMYFPIAVLSFTIAVPVK